MSDHLTDDERQELERERTRLVLAESDMKQAAIAGEYVAEQGADLNGDVERVLITGIIVTYVRCYTKSYGFGRVEGELAIPESLALRHFHQELLDRRDDLFAHTDDTPWRGSIEGLSGRHVEEYEPVDRVACGHIARLATAQRDRFRKRLDEIEEMLA